MTKHTDGLNDRAKDATIAQSGPGVPDDTGSPIEVTDEQIARVRSKLMKGDFKHDKENLGTQSERPKPGSD
ncbi:MAG TPA: hypothetical protein VFY63_05985 [Pseudorhizobium sp.]|nr:hypothetical protein [Pseudorhizobium sp.]